MSLVTHKINLAGAKQSTYVSMTERIYKVLVDIKFFESLPPNELLDLITQQMEKYNVSLEFVKRYRIHSEDIHGTTPKACQILWEIINELENKCNPDLINNQPLTQ